MAFLYCGKFAKNSFEKSPNVRNDVEVRVQFIRKKIAYRTTEGCESIVHIMETSQFTVLEVSGKYYTEAEFVLCSFKSFEGSLFDSKNYTLDKQSSFLSSFQMVIILDDHHHLKARRSVISS